MTEREAKKAIGIFDSGVGGLTVVRAVMDVLPDEQIVYLGDTARVPYGSKSSRTVIRYSRQISNFLLNRKIKYLVVACNTASAYAIGDLEHEVPVPVMDVVRPGAKVAAHTSKSGKIGVIGTLGTINSGAYQKAIHAIDSSISVFGQPCPLLVPLAEEGWIDHPVTFQIARHYLAELRTSCGDLDTIVLGCTHYPLLKQTLTSEVKTTFGESTRLVDSAIAVSMEVASDLKSRGLLRKHSSPPSHEFFFTDASRFGEIAERFLKKQIPKPKLADL